MSNRSIASQFNWIGLVIVAICLAILASIVFPAILAARHAANSDACKENLKQIGFSLLMHADKDPGHRMCSGAPSFRMDGSIDTHSWIADVIEINRNDETIGEKLMCPSNDITGLETFNEMLFLDPGQVKSSVSARRQVVGIAGAKDWNGKSANQSTFFAGTKSNSPERTSIVTRALVDQGYNSNYTASWFLTRSATKFEFNTTNSDIITADDSDPDGIRSYGMTLGPLKRRILETGPVVSYVVPMLGDSASSPQRLKTALAYGPTLSDGSNDPFSTSDVSKELISRNAKLAMPLTHGPATVDGKKLVGIGRNAILTTQVDCESSFSCGPPTKKNQSYLQDTRQWSAVHPTSSGKECNILMCDGSVQSFRDKDGDGFLNPGFPVPSGLSDMEKVEFGYKTGAVELVPGRIFSGIFLLNLNKRSSFEDDGGPSRSRFHTQFQPRSRVSSNHIHHGNGPQRSEDKFDLIEDNTTQKVGDQPVSTFSIDVDTASYSKTREYIMTHRILPPSDAVRIEEMVNYFDYSYARTQGENPFAVDVEIADCPWAPSKRLARIGLKGKEIERVSRDPCNLVFLIDVSGSMNSSQKLGLVKKGMRLLVQQLTDQDRVAIVVYAGAAGLVLPSTSCEERDLIYDSLNRLTAGGSTNGGQGIELAYAVAKQNFNDKGINRVVLCTDGDFNVGRTSNDELVRFVEEKAKSGVFLTALGFGIGNHNDAMMEQITNKGNGNYAYIDSEREASRVLQDQATSTLTTIAKDVKIQVEFNPRLVSTYRLVGYENRMLKKEDFDDDQKDAGEIGAGHTVTALYEITPATNDNVARSGLKYQTDRGLSKTANSDQLLTLKLRYKRPDSDGSKLMELPVKDHNLSFEQASSDFKFAAAVAAFGLKLRRSEYRGEMRLEKIAEIAKANANGDFYREGFVELVETTKQFSVD